ncbi:MAG: 2-C-methyl-D-erythritol 4-phosphate cytidylyltransferase [Candidatus Cloacimonetes bacterium]|nr:2-C-methyl-D-erythritol 4-phosphate cytidylyltransferase [Candidatus Cloacimonadota bacterium]
METMKIAAIITAGGMGLRLPGKVKKQFRLLAGKPLLVHTLQTFVLHPFLKEIIIVLPENDMESFRCVMDEYYPDIEEKHIVRYVSGGAQRQDSVYNALQACSADTDIVLIHDGVRPFVTKKIIDDLIALAKETSAAIPTAPVKNTIKTISGDIIDHTLRRDILLKAFTPQVFNYQLLMKCYNKAMKEHYYSTDDAALLEHYGYKVFYLNDSSHNIKITDEFDFFVAENLINFSNTIYED